MMFPVFALAAALTLTGAAASSTAAQPSVAQPSAAQPSVAQCSEWHDCQQRVLAAIADGAVEAAHDLAWRTVQVGPPNTPELMFLLARAQVLSGRPDDALVMVKRLATMKAPIAAEAATSDDFRRSRELAGWPSVAALLVPGSAAPVVAPAPASALAPLGAGTPAPVVAAPRRSTPLERGTPAPAPVPLLPSPESDAAASGPLALGTTEEAVRFSATPFTPGGLAYDAVSRRFLFGDTFGRKLTVVGEGADHAVDLVREDSAGFSDVMAIEIDVKRGDLWVASAPSAGGAGTVHKLQLVSGRPLKVFAAPPALAAVRLTDLLVTPAGVALALDATGGHLLAARVGNADLVSVARLTAEAPTSMAMGNTETLVYVAHRDGLSRVDLKTKAVIALTAAKGVSLAGIERLRWHRGSLVAFQLVEGGGRRLVRLELNTAGRAVTKAVVLNPAMPGGSGPVFATVSGDDLSYLIGMSGAEPGAATGAEPGRDLRDLVVQRIRLRAR